MKRPTSTRWKAHNGDYFVFGGERMGGLCTVNEILLLV